MTGSDSQVNRNKYNPPLCTNLCVEGLEFDEVIVPDADNGNYDSDYDRNLLYIACTRAMHKLTLHSMEIPSSLVPKEKRTVLVNTLSR